MTTEVPKSPEKSQWFIVLVSQYNSEEPFIFCFLQKDRKNILPVQRNPGLEKAQMNF